MIDLQHLAAALGVNDGGMSDAQLAALITAITTAAGIIGASIKWAVGRITKALDDNAASHAKGADAQIELAKAMTSMAHELREARDDIALVRGFVEEHTPVGGTRLPDELNERRGSRTRITPVRGVPAIVERHRTRGGDPDR